MLNFAIRYQPILREIQARRPARLLEVGSGPEGLALFWRGPLVGADIAFKRPPLHRAVGASVLALPFGARGWPLVVCCDTLEHIPPPHRPAAVRELARVTGQTLLLAFPSGPAAAACYVELARHLPAPHPAWLQEHLDYGLPDAGEVAGWLAADGWRVTTRWHEQAAAHARLMRWESRRPVQLLTYTLMRLAGRWLAPHWPSPTTGPWLRALLIAERERLVGTSVTGVSNHPGP